MNRLDWPTPRRYDSNSQLIKFEYSVFWIVTAGLKTASGGIASCHLWNAVALGGQAKWRRGSSIVL
jgi:hypothetical protein